jgi:uncharacterized protein
MWHDAERHGTVARHLTMILRDPVHGLVSFETDEYAMIPELIDTAEVQRLRRIRQLGLASFAYPGADHTRFAHAIGAAHVMTRFVRRLQEAHDVLPFWQRLTTDRARDAVIAALLHDVGHGPFSHLFEDAVADGPSHEDWTARILEDPRTEVHQVLTRSDASLPGRVADLIRGRHPLPYLSTMVSGTFDVDRCDYLLRDAHATGVEYGSFDLDWLLRSLRFGVAPEGEAPGLAIDGVKGLPAIESFIMARLFMFQQVYFHKTSRSSEWMLGKVIGRVRSLLLDGARVPGVPAALGSLATTGDADLLEYLALDDVSLWTAIDAWRGAPDPVLADLARRLVARRLFKSYELFGEELLPAERGRILDVARGIALGRKLDPDVYVGLDIARDVPFGGVKDTLSVIFADHAPQKPHEVSFVLGRLYGQELERIRLIFPPELRAEILAALGR